MNKVLPEFLLWWINQRSSQAYLATRSMGTMIKMISKQGLEDLEVRLPSLEQQAKIAEFFSLSMQEQRLLEELKHLKASYTQRILMRLVLESCETASHKTPGLDCSGSNSTNCKD